MDEGTPKNSDLGQFRLPKRLERMEQVLARRTRNLTLVLDNIQNAHNISAVIRSADAFGIQDLHFVTHGLEVSRSITLGAERWLSVHKHENAELAAARISELGYTLVVLQPESPQDSKKAPASLPITELPFEKKLALVFGNERSGVSEELFNQAQLFAHIPMYGFVESYNISVAAALCLFCATLNSPEIGRSLESLTKTEQETLRAEWLKKDMKRGDIISEALTKRIHSSDS